jgi:hypothetical protein
MHMPLLLLSLMGFKSSKGILIWINLGIAFVGGCACASRKWVTPHCDWAIGYAYAFTAIKPDGSIRTWGDPSYGGAYASGGYNLALGKPATQSSIYPHRWINLNITFVSGYVFAYILYVTPRILHVTPCRNWAIGFKSSKGFTGWINFDWLCSRWQHWWWILK